MHSARGLLSVQPGVRELATEEGRGESLRSWVVLGWLILGLRHGTSVVHAWCLVEFVANLHGAWWVFHLLSLWWELSWGDVLSLDCGLVCFDFRIDLGVQFSVFAHLLEDFVLVSSLRVFQSEVTFTLTAEQQKFKLQLWQRRHLAATPGDDTGTRSADKVPKCHVRLDIRYDLQVPCRVGSLQCSWCFRTATQFHSHRC